MSSDWLISVRMKCETLKLATKGLSWFFERNVLYNLYIFVQNVSVAEELDAFGVTSLICK